MGVYIKGMTKPKDCYNCNFNESNICCSITKGNIDRDDYTCEINCPLIEVSEPHGRLIDADEMERMCPEAWELIAHQSTIIEAEGEQ